MKYIEKRLLTLPYLSSAILDVNNIAQKLYATQHFKGIVYVKMKIKQYGRKK
jgi:hypothetical protein